MFKFLKNLIVKTAVVIEEKELKATEDKLKLEAAEKVAKEKEVAKKRQFYNDLKIEIENYFVSKVKKLEATIPNLHIKVGDRVVVNKYELLNKSSSNGWDTGARSLCGMYYKFNEDHYGPIYAKITNIHVSDSWFWEKVDKFLDDEGYSWMGYGMGEVDKDYLVNVGYRFYKWIEHRKKSSITDEFGFYINATFELENIDFKPQWGLNVYSFLQVDTEEAKRTIDAWETGKQLHELQQEFKAKEAKLKAYQSSCFN